MQIRVDRKKRVCKFEDRAIKSIKSEEVRKKVDGVLGKCETISQA